LPKYIASVCSIIEVDAESEEEARSKVLDIIESKPWVDHSTEIERGYPELEEA